MLSLTSEYALRATLYIATHSGNGPIKLDQIAEDLRVPRNYLSKTLHQLARLGVLRSDRGPSGGFRLGRPPAEMTLAEIVFPFDPLRFARRCILGRGQCSDENPCAAHHHWKTVAEPMRAFFSQTTVADLVESEAGNSGGRPQPTRSADPSFRSE